MEKLVANFPGTGAPGCRKQSPSATLANRVSALVDPLDDPRLSLSVPGHALRCGPEASYCLDMEHGELNLITLAQHFSDEEKSRASVSPMDRSARTAARTITPIA